MDAHATESELQYRPPGAAWLARERESGRFYRVATIGCGLLLIATLATTAVLLRRGAEPGTLISPPLIALLLVINLLPAIGLMVLIAREVARRNAEARGIGTGQLHTRLVALFSMIAAVPTVLIAIFASLLLQSGLEFWFSNRARNMIESTVSLAHSVYAGEEARVANNTLAMAGDLAGYLKVVAIDDPRFADAYGRLQVLQTQPVRIDHLHHGRRRADSNPGTGQSI